MRRNSQKWIPFGFDTVSNKIVDIASVENGLSCNCICLICGTSLIAKQGKNQKWHFSHSTEVKGVCSELTLQHGFVNGMVASHLLCHSGTINRHSLNGALLS
ncbi:hypothetical protein [Klebsiella pneumoniae]|uniref:hypothetical protein n=1 Tax=Klebsiella pneumoniae TaxID=573 RepID=UPI0038B5FB10